MINKLNITLKDWISIIASLVQYNCDYLAFDTDNTKDEAAGETEHWAHNILVVIVVPYGVSLKRRNIIWKTWDTVHVPQS